MLKEHKTISSYISAQSKQQQIVLKEMYQIVKGAAPKTTEAIKYGMPTLVSSENLVHFAAMKGHLGFYPGPSPILHFAKELEPYSTSKGCIRFSYDKPLPKSLIIKIVKFRVKEAR
jgi:uncharacterized protein YdhG (YjbR/CyaY superfamily)